MNIRARIRERWGMLRAWAREFWRKTRPGPEARKGAAWGAVAATTAAAVYAGTIIHTGLGAALDILLGLLLVALAIPFVGVLVAGLLSVLRKLPRFVTGVVLGAMALISFLWPVPLGVIMGAVIALVEATFGAAVATFLLGGFRGAALSKKILTITLFVLALATNAGLYAFFRSEGTTARLIREKQPNAAMPPALRAPNPAGPGSNGVKTLFYGSGTDRRRAEYGSSVALRTPTVDASLMLSDLKGIKKRLRRAFWGFDVDKIPSTARLISKTSP